jgi:hypothetical protein
MAVEEHQYRTRAGVPDSERYVSEVDLLQAEVIEEVDLRHLSRILTPNRVLQVEREELLAHVSANVERSGWIEAAAQEAHTRWVPDLRARHRGL